jgi:hypothetical protein
MAAVKDSSPLSIRHVLLVLVLFLIEGSMCYTSWSAPMFVPAYELLNWWNECHATEGQDTFCHFMTDVRNSEVESDNNAGLQCHDWQQILENRDTFKLVPPEGNQTSVFLFLHLVQLCNI